MFEQMLDLDCCIKSHIRKLFMESTCDTQSMCWSIKEIGIAKGDVTNALCRLFSDISQHNLGGYSKETSVINWCDWTMKTGMFATTRCFGIAGKHLFPMNLQACIAIR